MNRLIGIVASSILATGTAFAGDTNDDKSFDELDGDRNGVVTKEELASEIELLARFDVADTDRDGMLTFSEFESIREDAENAEEAE